MITGIGYDDQYPRSNLERIVVYPFLVTCSLEGLGFLYDVLDI